MDRLERETANDFFVGDIRSIARRTPPCPVEAPVTSERFPGPRVSRPFVAMIRFPCLLSATTAFTAPDVAAAGLIYVYDDLGRLKRVIDEHGDIATCNYDPVGNILSIERGAPSCPVQAPVV